MQELFRKYLDNQCTAEEISFLLTLFDNPENELQLKNFIRQSIEQEQAEPNNRWTIAVEEVYENITEEMQPIKGKLIPIYKRTWFKMAAACILIIFGIGGYILLSNSTESKGLAENNLPKDIQAPTTSKAMITLSDGRKVYLDSAANGELAMQSNVKLVKLANGEIVYQSTIGDPDNYRKVTELQYNTLFNPRGSKTVSLSLNDGTKVWLNSESSIKYPIAFAGNERKVEITGEAYFEVAHNTAKPFKVNVAGKEEVEVLGTHFNINSYTDEPYIKTTLLEGSVKVTKDKESLLLKPGQQSLVNSNEIKLIRNADVETSIAWKNGRFLFNAANLETIFRQAARWYNVEMIYSGKTNETFSGGMPRSENISQLVKILEATGKVKFIINKNQIIVKPK